MGHFLLNASNSPLFYNHWNELFYSSRLAPICIRKKVTNLNQSSFNKYVLWTYLFHSSWVHILKKRDFHLNAYDSIVPDLMQGGDVPRTVFRCFIGDPWSQFNITTLQTIPDVRNLRYAGSFNISKYDVG